MRVMHVSPADSVLCLGRFIEEQKKEHGVIDVVLKQASCPDSTDYSIQENGSKIIVEDVKRIWDYYYDPKLRRTFDVLFKKYKPDIVHIHVFPGFSLLPILNTASSLGIKKVLTLNDHSLIRNKSRIFYKRVKCIIDQCDTIICSSRHQRDLLEKLFGENEKIISSEGVSPTNDTIYSKILNKEDRRLFFKLGHLCNSKCLHCVAGPATEPFVDLRVIKKEMEKRAADYGRIIFTGGEPTMHPQFFELLAIAFYLGCKIEVQSNIRIFSNKKFAAQTKKFNVKIIVCMNSSREKIFDLMADAPGAFKQTIQGLRNLINEGIEVSAKIIITNHNCGHLSEIVQFVKDSGINDLMLVFPTPMGQALKNFRQINPRYSDVLPAVHGALQWGIDHNMRMAAENIPPCLLEEKYYRYNSEYANRDNLDGIYMNDFRKGLYNCRKERVEVQKLKVRGCAHCPYSCKCEGIYREYVKNFGEEEFHNDVIRSRAHIQPLRGSPRTFSID